MVAIIYGKFFEFLERISCVLRLIDKTQLSFSAIQGFHRHLAKKGEDIDLLVKQQKYIIMIGFSEKSNKSF